MKSIKTKSYIHQFTDLKIMPETKKDDSQNRHPSSSATVGSYLSFHSSKKTEKEVMNYFNNKRKMKQ